MSAPDLAALTGVRSGKRSYYRAYIRSDERTQRAVRAMDSISRALVRTVEGPRGLLEEVVRAAAAHLEAEWTLLALADGHLTGARPRFLVLDTDGHPVDLDEDLPGQVRRELGAIRAGLAVRSPDDDRWVRVPMTLEGRQIGALVGLHRLASDPEPGDLAVLRILANQAAVSLHTSEQYQASLALHRKAQQMYDQAEAHARDLEARTSELRQAERRLVLAHQRELIDAERHRIARELHDSVTQYVISAGIAVEVARGEAEGLTSSLEGDGRGLLERLQVAKHLSQQAVGQLRRAIYALDRAHSETVAPLPELLREVAEHHRMQLAVQIRVEGAVATLPADADHEIARAVGEALFNVTLHAGASRAVVRLCYRPDELFVTVSDDGRGHPAELTRLLAVERSRPGGTHRGLANIESRVVDLGGEVAFRRSRLGGVRVELRVPLPLPADRPGLVAALTRPTEPARGVVTR